MEDKDRQCMKAPQPSLVIPSGARTLTAAREKQHLNVSRPIVVIPLGRVMEERDLQQSKTLSPSSVSPSGRVRLTSELQIKKA